MMNKILCIIISGFLTAVFSTVIHFIPKIQKNISQSRRIFSELTSNLEESLSGTKIVQAFAN